MHRVRAGLFELVAGDDGPWEVGLVGGHAHAGRLVELWVMTYWVGSANPTEYWSSIYEPQGWLLAVDLVDAGRG